MIFRTLASTCIIWMSTMTILGIVASPGARAELIEDAEDIETTAPVKPSSPSKSPHSSDSAPKSEPGSKAQQAGSPAKPTAEEAKPAPKSKGKAGKAGVVKFWSKSLSGLKNPGTLMLEENVVVTQDDVRLEADKATIFFESKSRDVREVHAVGSVKFTRTDPDTGLPVRAEGREAIFNNSKRLVTMKGEPVLYRGEDVVRGKIIYYDLQNGWVKADRVEGVVQPSTKKPGAPK